MAKFSGSFGERTVHFTRVLKIITSFPGRGLYGENLLLISSKFSFHDTPEARFWAKSKILRALDFSNISFSSFSGIASGSELALWDEKMTLSFGFAKPVLVSDLEDIRVCGKISPITLQRDSNHGSNAASYL